MLTFKTYSSKILDLILIGQLKIISKAVFKVSFHSAQESCFREMVTQKMEEHIVKN